MAKGKLPKMLSALVNIMRTASFIADPLAGWGNGDLRFDEGLRHKL